MDGNRVKEIWDEGGAALSGWLHLPNTFSAELMARAGWDCLVVDMQHGPVDYASALSMLQAISTTGGPAPFVRVPWNEPGLIMRVLDAGSLGVICPMVDTRADAEAFVGACRYPPDGYRSYGPYRASIYGGPDYADRANERVVTMAMIETKEALDNLDDILAVPGLDAVFVGPADLGQSLGLGPGVDREEPEVLEAFDRILAAAKARGVEAGLFTGSAAYASRMIERGFRFVAVLSDARLMAAAAADVVGELRAGRQA